MDDFTEITAYIPGLQTADETAAQKLWEQFYDRLIRLAHRNLSQLSRREADEEDVVLSAMHSFMRGAAEGRFPQLNDRNDLWKLLVTCTLRKVSKQRKRQHAAKRGKNVVRGESVFADAAANDGRPPGLADAAVAPEPTPELAAELSETMTEMLAELGEDDLKEIALMKLEGYRNNEIAQHRGVAEKTIQRKLRRIEERWVHRTGTNPDSAE